MRVLRDFKCPSGHTTESFEENTVDHITCHCGERASKLVASPRFKLEGITGDYPTAAQKWESQRKEKLRQEQKLEQ